MILTRENVQAITGDADRWTDALNNALIRWDISTPARVIAFLAQCGHESGGFKHLVENLNYSAAALRATWPARFSAADAVAMERKPERIAERAYGGRMGNGPEGSGDGFRYRGRGIIQLTGRDNYKRAGDAIGLDFVAQPELLEQPDWAASSAGWFWATNGCNALADAGDFLAVTKRINGGTNGLADRQAWLAKVQAIVPAPAVATQPAAPIEDHSTTYQSQEAPMPIAVGLLAQLIPQVLGLFSQRAQATIVEKTGADPKLAGDFMQGLIKTVGERVAIPVVDDKSAIAAVGKLVTEVQPGTPAAKDLEDHSLDYLHKLTEAAEAIVDVRKAEVAIETSAMDAASTRNDASEVRKRFDNKVWWAYGIAAGILGAIAVAQVLMGKQVDGQIIGALILAFGGLGSAILMMGNYGYGSSGSSGAKDALIGEMASRRQQPGGKP